MPEIARFFGITVDELLQIEKLDEQKLFAKYEQKAREFFRNGDRESNLEVWKEAYHAMPNNLAVKEMLMSAYFDADKVKYKQDIIEIGTELYRATLKPDAGETETYYRGQAISQLSKTYADNGDSVSAEKWAVKASYLMHAQEFLFAQITSGKDLLNYFRFSNYWYFKNLFYMVYRITNDEELSSDGYDREVTEIIIKLYETAYADGDMDFEMSAMICELYLFVAEDESKKAKNENTICANLTKAMRAAEKSIDIKKHSLSTPFFKGIGVDDAPTDNKQIVRGLSEDMERECFNPYKNSEWYISIQNNLNKL